MSIFLAALLSAAPTPTPVVTIIADMRHVCTIGRIADMERAKVMRQANEAARKVRAEGKRARIVKVDGLITVSGPNDVRVTRPGC